MVYLTRKKKRGNYYLYLEEKAWINGKTKRVWQKYLGPEDKIRDLKFGGLLTKHADQIRVETMEFGISAALWKMAQKIQLVDIIDNHTKKIRNQGLSVGEYLVIAAINRCTMPTSKAGLRKWFAKDWLSTQFEIEPKKLSSQAYWNHFQYFNEDILRNIEATINKTVVDTFQLDLDTLFYDPTNFYTYSKKDTPDSLLQFGHSKEGRNGNKLVSYSLLCARESGVPLMHESYPGNENDAKRFKQVPLDISKRLSALGHDPESVTLVFDKGNHSKEAFLAIDRAGFGFIVSIRNSTQKDLLHIPRDQFTPVVLPSSKKSVEYYKTTRKLYGVERDAYVVWDPKKHKKHEILFKTKLTEKKKSIESFFLDRLNVKKWRKKEAVEKKLKSFIGRKPFKDVIKYDLCGEYGQLKLNLFVDEKSASRHMETLGRTILFTNRHKWPADTIIWSYREQYIVEHAFREMKCPTSIAVRPMYHRCDLSIRVHVFTCVLALLLLSLLRLTLARDSLHLSYSNLLEELKGIHVLKITSSPKGTPMWKLENAGGIARTIIKKLGLSHFIHS